MDAPLSRSAHLMRQGPPQSAPATREQEHALCFPKKQPPPQREARSRSVKPEKHDRSRPPRPLGGRSPQRTSTHSCAPISESRHQNPVGVQYSRQPIGPDDGIRRLPGIRVRPAPTETEEGKASKNDKTWNSEISGIRAPAGRAIAWINSWNILHTDHRHPLSTYATPLQSDHWSLGHFFTLIFQ